MITDSVFSPSFGNRPQVFVGRTETIASVLQGLQEMPGSRERAVLVLGHRGYGKTVLLFEIADAARRAGYIVASPTVVSSEMHTRILEKLTEEGRDVLPKKKKQVAGGSIGVLGFSADLQFQGEQTGKISFAGKLSELCRQINQGGKGVLILIDELVANQEELRQLVIAYQEMVGEGRNVAMILAGLPSAVATTLQDHLLTFLNRAKKIELEPLRIREIDSYYQEVFAKLGVMIPAKLRTEAAEATKGSPYLMQLIGHYITIGASAGRTVTEDELTEALGRAAADFRNDICQTSLKPLSEKDVAFLAAMAQEDAEEIRISDIQQRIGATSSYTQTYKRRLIQSGIIEQTGRGKVRFAIPFLREYLNEQ